MVRICIIIPAYNEASAIGSVIHGINNSLSNIKHEYKIVVIDDGSKDNTVQEAEKSGAKIISHIVNVGSGGATATGLSYASQHGYDFAATIDADGQHDPENLREGIEIMLKNRDLDLLIGSRLIDSSGMAKIRVVGNKGLSLFTFLLFGVKVTDSQSGLRILSKKALAQLKLKTSGYEFCSEMLWRANQLKLAIEEFPIRAIYTEYSKSKGQSNWNAYNIALALIKRRIVELINE